MTLSPRLSPRRFPETIVLWRETPAERNAAGEYVEGVVIETELRASIQPLALGDADIAGGVSLIDRLKVYVAAPDALRAAFDDLVADRVLWDGETYTVVESQSWPGRHCRATLLRAT